MSDEEEPEAPKVFDPMEFDRNWTVTREEFGSAELTLAGAGMRRKDVLWVLAFDVYKVGFYCSPFTLLRVQNCIRNGDVANLCDVMLDVDGSAGASAASVGKPHIAMVLRMVRDVEKEQTLTAFGETFAGIPQEDIDSFKVELGNRVDESGTHIGEEIIFFWKQGGGLTVTQRDESPPFSCPSVERRLLEIYLDKERTICPDLLRSVEDFVCDIDA